MKTKKYLFKRASDGFWIFGDTIDSVCNSSTFRVDFEVETNNILIFPSNSINPIDCMEGSYYDFIKENGSTYTSLSEFKTNTKGFFTSIESSEIQKIQLTDQNGNSITQSSCEPRILSCEYTRPTNTATRPAYGAINETVSVIKELLAADSKQAANLVGGGGVVINGSIVSNNTSDVGRQFGIIFLREDISPIIADNAVQTMLYANQGKRIMVVYATMEAQSANSDVVIGRFNLPFEYQCKADSKALKALLFDVTGGTTVSGSKYMVTVNVQVQK